MKKQSDNQHSAVRLRSRQAVGRRGLTLIELLVVIGTISLVLGIALPGMIGLFTAGADIQAQNVISAMLGAARGLAIEGQTYAIVHIQISTDGKCWAAVLKYDSDSDKFIPTADFIPRQMPGNMAFGEISANFVSGGSYQATMNNDAGLRDFTTFNVIFSPDGAMAARNFTPQIETNVKIFGGDGATSKQKIWDTAGVTLNEPGVRAITAFSYKTLKAVSSRNAWLEKNGQFLCINPYTGQLLEAK